MGAGRPLEAESGATLLVVLPTLRVCAGVLAGSFTGVRGRKVRLEQGRARREAISEGRGGSAGGRAGAGVSSAVKAWRRIRDTLRIEKCELAYLYLCGDA